QSGRFPRRGEVIRSRTCRFPRIVIYTIWYIPCGESILAIAKVFQTGRSQAIRLPKDFRVNVDEVRLKRTSDGFLVITTDPWDVFWEGVNELGDDFMSAGRDQPPLESGG